MRPFNVRLLSCIGILSALTMIVGCGADGDLLDEPGQRYTATIAIQDLDTPTLTVDIIQDFCETEVEPYGPASAAVEFGVEANAPGITLKSYTLEYIPLPSEDGTGTVVMPPVLSSPLVGGNLGIDIGSGGTASFEITCISVDTKEEYRTKVGWLYNFETVGGQALITAKAAEVAAKEIEIDTKLAEIVAAEAAGQDTAGLQLQLTALEEDLEQLQAELAALPFEFWSVPLLDEARYKIRVTFLFEDSSLEDRTIVREATVWFGNFDNC